MNEGFLIVNAYADNVAQPLKGATVLVNGKSYLTDISGKTIKINLSTPSIDLSSVPGSVPYATYDVEVSIDGFSSTIKDVKIFPDITAYQNVFLNFENDLENESGNITLTSDDAFKIVEDPVKSLVNTIVLPLVLVPEYVIVHDGIPTDTKAVNYTVPFKEYIKKVACCEIYPTWPIECLKANITAIISFTLNRIYTEWYTSKGYGFTITSVTSHDQKYSNDMAIYDTIDTLVDEMFLDYISLSGLEQPFLAQYNDGVQTNNIGWLSQWGSYTLAQEGYTYKEILEYYYSPYLDYKKAIEVFGYPVSYPGYDLSEGMCGEEIQKMQNELNSINKSYPGIPLITNPNGIYDSETTTTVKKFQDVFNLNETGIIDLETWYKISYIYVAVNKMIAGIFG